MYAVFDFVPKYCPNCGEPIKFVDREARADYWAGITHFCDRRCGFEYQRAETDHVIEAAVKSGGDADQYWS